MAPYIPKPGAWHSLRWIPHCQSGNQMTLPVLLSWQCFVETTFPSPVMFLTGRVLLPHSPLMHPNTSAGKPIHHSLITAFTGLPWHRRQNSSSKQSAMIGHGLASVWMSYTWLSPSPPCKLCSAVKLSYMYLGSVGSGFDPQNHSQ